MEDYLSHFLPEEILTYFDIIEVKELWEISTRSMIFQIYLEEKNILSSSYNTEEYESKGFCGKAYIQDFPYEERLFIW